MATPRWQDMRVQEAALCPIYARVFTSGFDFFTHVISSDPDSPRIISLINSFKVRA
jgi:hypothetical protein